MDPTLFASFRDVDAAEQAFNALLDIGVQPEDLSLLVNEYAPGGPPAGPEIDDIERGAEVDQGYDPEVTFDPAVSSGIPLGEPRLDEQGDVHMPEPELNVDVAPHSPGAPVALIGEDDDGQSMSEEMLYGEEYDSATRLERHDVTEGATEGYFNTTKPEGTTLNGNEPDGESRVEIDSITVHGLGRVVGDGALATLATGAAVAAATAGRPAASVPDYLTDAGVPQSEVDELYSPFSRGGAILAATVRPGDSTPERAEETINQFCPEVVRTYNDIPEPNG